MSNDLGGNAFTRNIRSHEALPSTSCDLCTCNGWSCYGQWLRRCITKKIHYLALTPRSRESRSPKCCPVPSTSCDLCTSKVWCCYIPWLRRRCIYKKIHYLIFTMGWRSHKMFPSTLDIMWPMHHQSVILLHPTVKEKMHLQENTLFDLDLIKGLHFLSVSAPSVCHTYSSEDLDSTWTMVICGPQRENTSLRRFCEQWRYRPACTSSVWSAPLYFAFRNLSYLDLLQGKFESHFVGNAEDRFSCVTAHIKNTRLRSPVCNVFGCRCMSDCRSRDHKFDPGPVPYFCRDWSWNISMTILLPSTDSRRAVVRYKWKYVHKVLVNHWVKLAQEKSDRPDMTIAVDWDVKHQPKTYSKPYEIYREKTCCLILWLDIRLKPACSTTEKCYNIEILDVEKLAIIPSNSREHHQMCWSDCMNAQWSLCVVVKNRFSCDTTCMGLIGRKLVFGVSNEARLKPVSSAKGTS